MPKIKIFLWKMCHNALTVRGTLLRRGCHIDPQCPLCLEDTKSTDHVFGGQTNTYVVWGLTIHHQWIPPQVRINHTQDWFQSLKALKNICNSKLLKLISSLLWSIWKARNAVILQNEIFNPMKCLIKAKKLSAEQRIRNCLSVDDISQGLSFTSSKIYKFIRWHSRNFGRVKLNFDGSLQINSAAG